MADNGMPKLSEYAAMLREQPQLAESSPARLYRIVQEGSVRTGRSTRYPFFASGAYSIKGIPDVTEQLGQGIHAASVIASTGKMLFLFLVGPTGSGKTEFQYKMMDGLANYLEHEPRYTFVLKGGKEETPAFFAEDPAALLASPLAPADIRATYRAAVRNGGLAAATTEAFEKLLRKARSGDFLAAADERVDLVPLYPRLASVELFRKDFPDVIENAVRRANRGILSIEVDDRPWKDLPDTNYQILLKLRDGKVSLRDGSVFSPDLVVMLYGNGMDGFDERKPLKDRTHIVYARRNLSPASEEEIYRKMQLPFEHDAPHALHVLAEYVVSTRVQASSVDDIRERLGVYERYEHGLPVSDHEIAELRKRIPGNAVPTDGGTDGISSLAFIAGLSMQQHGRCLTPEAALDFIRSHDKNNFRRALYEGTMERHVMRDVIKAFLTTARGQHAIEATFSDYLRLYHGLTENTITTVQVPGKGFVAVQDELDRLARNLYVTGTNGRQALDDAIDTFYRVREAHPKFDDILESNPGMFVASDDVRRYMPWKHYAAGIPLTGQDEQHRTMLLSSLKALGYCDECGASALRVAAAQLGE